MAEARRSRFAGAEALAQDVSPFVGRAVEQGERLRGSVAALFPEGGVRQGPETGLEMFGRRSLPDVGSFPMPGGGTLGEKMQDPATQEAIEFIIGGPLMAMTPLTAMVRAFHGTPHKFTKFSKAKVGSGQGAQSFGHGLYFAENPKVARSYQALLADEKGAVTRAGAAFEPSDEIEAAAAHAYRLRDGDAQMAKEAVERVMSRQGKDLNDIRRASDLIDEFEISHPGSMMEVTIDADPEDFLDWDKPLSQQSPKVQEAIESTGRFRRGMHDDMTGEQIYHDLERSPQVERLAVDAGNRTGIMAEETSNMLREAGIPGIRYLDQGSRGPAEFPFRVKFKSDGADAFLASTMEEAQEFIADNPKLFEIVDNSDEFTRNIVLFDDSLVEIQSINDVPLPKARGAAKAKSVALADAPGRAVDLSREDLSRTAFYHASRGDAGGKPGSRRLGFFLADTQEGARRGATAGGTFPDMGIAMSPPDTVTRFRLSPKAIVYGKDVPESIGGINLPERVTVDEWTRLKSAIRSAEFSPTSRVNKQAREIAENVLDTAYAEAGDGVTLVRSRVPVEFRGGSYKPVDVTGFGRSGRGFVPDWEGFEGAGASGETPAALRALGFNASFVNDEAGTSLVALTDDAVKRAP